MVKLPVYPRSSDIPCPATTRPRPSRAATVAIATLVTAASTAACCARPTAPAAAPPPAIQLLPPDPGGVARSPAYPPASSSSPPDRIVQLATPSAYPSSDAAGRQDARAAAAAAMQAFARHDLPTPLWWAGLAPLLSPAAAAAYQGVDSASVPVHQVTGAAYPTGDTGSPYLTRMAVPTDAGDYTVLLSRAGQGQRWLVERLTPPPRR